MASIAFQIRSTLVFCKIGDGYGQDAPIEYSSGAGKYCNDVVPSDHAFAFIEQYPIILELSCGFVGNEPTYDSAPGRM
jgi:hypothetical protein